MSRKKAFSGSTMTLKDFHGGSIPSDLPLPSAPGVVVRPSDRTGFDRQIPNAWGGGNPIGIGIGRSDHHRSRPGSSGTNRTSYDEKTSFFSHPAHIGRNFDEDERKPLDGISVPRRSVSDESIRVLPTSRPELTKPESPSSGRFSVSQSVSANPVRFPGSVPVGANAQTSSGAQVASSLPNAWGTRKEVVSVSEPVHSSTWSGPNAVSRFAQASALEKVSSGRWQSKHPIVHQPDVEIIRFSDDNDFPSNKVQNSFNRMDLSNERGDIEVVRGRYFEKSWVIEDENTGSKVSPIHSEAKERNLSFNRDGIRPASSEGKLGGSQMPIPMSAEPVERPKIKLLPRSKPLETSESPIVDFKQGYQPPLNSVHVEAPSELHGNETSSKPGSAGSEGGNRAVDRPRLNLKPRSQPLEQSEGIAERERKALFGGARPRELVLKERGVDDDVINSLDVIQSPNRVKLEHPKTETKAEPVISIQAHGGRADSFLHDQKNGKVFERKDHRSDSDKTEYRGSWRNENWRNSREPEQQQQQQQQQQERRPEPDSWRKPVDQPSLSPPDAAGLRYGKAASALELAQAFSRSNSGPKTTDRVSVQRPLPGRNQIPFSRLTDTRLTDTREFYSGPTPRRQINGY